MARKDRPTGERLVVMSDENDQPDADRPAELEEPNAAAELGEAGQSEDEETLDEPGGHVVTLDEIRKDAERSIETFERLNATAQPWAKGVAFQQEYFENLRKALNPLAGVQFNYQNQLAGLYSGLTNLSGILESPAMKGMAGNNDLPAFASMMAGQLKFAEQFRSGFLAENMSKALGSFYQQRHEVGKYLGRTDLPGFATSTYEFLTTTEDLKYSSNRKVWHYTSGWVLMQVLNNHLFWASSPQHLNDASEVKHGVGIIRDALKRAMDALRQEGELTQQRLRDIEKAMLSEVLDDRYINTVIKEIYYISASADDDSLTLWRNYANGDGFAIGIDAGVELSADGFVLDPDDEDMDPRKDVPPINGWYRVHYTDQKKKMLADDFVTSAIKDIRKTKAIHLPALVSELRKQTLILASTMKHKAFKDEKEVRWMTTNWMPVDVVVDVVHYEHARNSIVPVLHIKTSSDEPRPLPLRGVRCSPVAPDGIERTIEGLLRQKGYKSAGKNVRKSQQPFKG